jgi:hypothetical protein
MIYFFDHNVKDNPTNRVALREIVSIIGAIQFIKIFNVGVAKGEIGYETIVNEAYYDRAVTDDTKDYLDAFCKRLIYVFLYFTMNAYFTY